MKALTLCLIFVLGSETLWACSCVAPPPPKTALKKATAVFVGQVRSIERNGRIVTVRFEISRTWKGTKGKSVKVLTATRGSACGYSFKVGTSYLVYCYRPKGERSVLRTNICTRTKTLSRAKDDLKNIGPGRKPT